MATANNKVGRIQYFTSPHHTTLTDACAATIRKAIHDGVFAPGSKLPGEMELVEQLGVSRTTLREAQRTLEEEGLIQRRRGIGTFVKEVQIEKDMTFNTGITMMIDQAGQMAIASTASIREDTASDDVAQALQIDLSTPVIVVERVRSVSQIPVVWTIDVVPVQVVDVTGLSNFDLQHGSLYEFFHDILKIRITRGTAYLFPVSANQEMARILNVKKGSPLMRIIQTDYDQNDRPVIYSIEYHIPDYFVFKVNRKGPHR